MPLRHILLAMSVSSTDESDFEMPAAPVQPVRRKRNLDVIEPVLGEGNVKGFVSAFETIMGRESGVSGLGKSEPPTDAAAVRKTAPVEHVLPCHNTRPEPTDEALSGAARRGVLKLFKAVSMHRKTSVAKARVNRRDRPVKMDPSKPASMSSFLEMLKAQKVKRGSR